MPKLGKTIFLFLLAFSLFFSIASAAIEPPPTPASNTDFTGYAKFIYPFAISVGAILAVIMLIVAGLQMMTASEGQRTAAKERIQNALLGLLLLVGVFIILKTSFWLSLIKKYGLKELIVQKDSPFSSLPNR